MNPGFFEQFPTKRDLAAFLQSKPETSGVTAAQFIRDNLPKESAFQTEIIRAVRRWAAVRSIPPASFLWKHSAGVYNNNGLPDLMLICDGLFFAFEVKRPYVGKITALQEKAVGRINAAGGHAAIVSYPSEVKTILTRSGVWRGAE